LFLTTMMMMAMAMKDWHCDLRCCCCHHPLQHVVVVVVVAVLVVAVTWYTREEVGRGHYYHGCDADADAVPVRRKSCFEDVDDDDVLV
jgi:hypothetical protein